MSSREECSPKPTHEQDTRLFQANALRQELDWLSACISYRLEHYFKEDFPDAGCLPEPPALYFDVEDYYGQFLFQQKLSSAERLILILALAPRLHPNLLDIFLAKNPVYDRTYSEFGGTVSDSYSGFLPTLQTAWFILSGGDLGTRLKLQHRFDLQHALFLQGWLQLPDDENIHTEHNLSLLPSQLLLEYHVLGNTHFTPHYSDFPAKKIDTEKSWSDLILSKKTQNQLQELQAWLQYGAELLRVEGTRYFKPGYRCLFYGPPGTGKTLTASLLGKLSQQPVYRIDLSQLVSKYIGETEKNLERIFSLSERNQWILFFDEADALFGKRTQISNANDRYANQGTAYLLQRIEDCPNIIILASNLKDNFDDAFMRRFQSCIYFPLPGRDERLKLWQQGLIGRHHFQSPDFDLTEIADHFEISGGTISNVIRYASLMAMQQQRRHFLLSDLREGIRRELDKIGKSL